VIAYQEHTRSLCVVDTSVRIDTALLNQLEHRAADLLLLRQNIVESLDRACVSEAVNYCTKIGLLAEELQSLLERARRQPINSIFSRLPRVVRDLAGAAGKQIRLELEGEDIQVDRPILEAIKGPLAHLIRNAVDHGIETSDLRLACGKRTEGRIRVRAACEEGQFTLEVDDDGAGIDLDCVRQKALAMQLINAEQAAAMNENQTASLVFCPGLSTSQNVTMLSGRGVGLDVVTTSVEQIGGSINLRTARHHGTTVVICIPLSLDKPI